MHRWSSFFIVNGALQDLHCVSKKRDPDVIDYNFEKY